MTELELLELLGDLHSGYIQEAQGFRSGKARVQARRKHRLQKYIAMAAMLAVLVGLGGLALPYLAANWVHSDSPALSTESTAAATEPTAEVPPLSPEFQAILTDQLTFYSSEIGDVTLAAYTEYLRTRLQTQNCQAFQYAVLDIDQDGAQELVVQFRHLGETYGTLLLGNQSGRLRGDFFLVQELDCLKSDGSFRVTYPSGDRWERLHYDGQRWIYILQWDGPDSSSLPDAPWQPIPERTEDTPVVSQRDLDTTLTYTVNGQEIQKDATLWSGSRFTMYILGPEDDSGWVHSTVSYGDIQADRWTYADQDLDGFLQSTSLDFANRQYAQQYYENLYPIRLTVAYLPEEDLSAAQAWVRQCFPDTELVSSAQGRLYTAEDAAETLEVYFTPATGGYLVQLREAPPEAGNEAIEAMAAMGGSLMPVFSSPTAAGTRPERTFFTVMKYENGAYTEQQEPFQLCQGDGWATYVPYDGQWIEYYTALPIPRDYPHQSILCAANSSVHFTVADLGAQTLESCIAWAMEGYADRSPWEGKDGSTVVAGDTTIRFVPYLGGYYALLVTYPASETEGLGVYVQLMCDQFRGE